MILPNLRNFVINREKKLQDIVKLYIKKCVSRRKNVKEFIQRDQEHE